MIVSVNPYTVLEQMGEGLIPDYQQGAKEHMAPHLYALAQQAFNVRVLSPRLPLLFR